MVRCNGPLVVGFHCGNDIGGLGADHHAWLLVGYVVGPDVTRVRIVVDGHAFAASTQPLSENPAVQVYWLAGPVLENHPPKGSGVGTVGLMTALDAHGRVVTRAVGAIAHG